MANLAALFYLNCFILDCFLPGFFLIDFDYPKKLTKMTFVAFSRGIYLYMRALHVGKVYEYNNLHI